MGYVGFESYDMLYICAFFFFFLKKYICAFVFVW
jgi:hypothetical protein